MVELCKSYIYQSVLTSKQVQTKLELTEKLTIQDDIYRQEQTTDIKSDKQIEPRTYKKAY